MVIPPIDWVRTEHGKADSGGYLLSEFTNVSYQGFLDKKSFQLHEHNLHLKTVTSLNNLQKCKFAINTRMVAFVVKFGKELTESEKLLITDKWLEPNKDLVLNVNKKWAKIFNSATEVRRSIYKELAANKQQTMRNQEVLRIAKLYSDKTIYWRAVFDFRGRVYRIGNLNIQMDEFVRSLIFK
uniref:Uncharacterized protein n=1 Tax=Ulva compressa TaxID=63659 RepID=A0A3S6PB10_ULVCO|nr:hypothetical protein [Ulva compressa]ATP01502.1 hypothetical protein [Ulva compressa]